MARWLRDADTGELFPADEVDPSSYDVVGSETIGAPQYEYPEWTTGLGGIPARGIASAASGGAGALEMLGDWTDWDYLQNFAQDTKIRARDLADQARRQNEVEQGSGWDIAQGAAGDLLVNAPMITKSLLTTGGKLAGGAAMSALPSLQKYSNLRDRGVEPGDAATGAAESFGLNSLLNLFDLGSVTKGAASSALQQAYRRAVPIIGTNVATNAVSSVGDLLVDAEARVPQTQEEFLNALKANTLAGVGTGALFTGLSTIPRIRSGAGAVADVDSDAMLNALTEGASPPPPEGGTGAGEVSADVSPRASLGLPEVEFQPYSRTQAEDIPVLESPTVEEPLIQPVEGYRTRDLAAEQRRVDDFFYPEDSELAYLRESPTEGSGEVIDIQKGKPAEKPIVDSVEWDAELAPQERQAADAILRRSSKRSAQARIDDNQAAFDELMAKREEARRSGRESYSKTDRELVIKTGDEVESFPQPIIRNLAEATQRAPAQLELPPGTERQQVPGPEALAPERVRGPIEDSGPTIEAVETYAPRTPPEVVSPLQDGMVAKSSSIADSEIPIVGQEPLQIATSEVVTPDGANASPSSIVLDPSSDLVQQRAAAMRLVRGERQATPDLTASLTEAPAPNSSPIVVEEWYRTRPSAPEAQRGKVAQRMANRTKKKVSRAEAGSVPLDLLLAPISIGRWAYGKLAKTGADSAQMPTFQAMSEGNRRYSGIWGKYIEWMTTTRARNPQAAKYIDAVTSVFTDRSSLVYDFNETIAPFRELPQAEQGKVGAFLKSARAAVNQTKDLSRGVSFENAKKVGLTDEQAKAAVSVNRAMENWLDTLQAEAVEQAIHDQRVTSMKSGVPNDGFEALSNQLQQIDARFTDLRNKSYIPFNRYGSVYITLKNPDGSTFEHRTFTSRDKNYRAALAAMQQEAKQKGLGLSHGEQPPRADNEYHGVSQDILDILGDQAGITSVDGFPRHLKEAKLVKGEDPDVYRAISEYALGASRFVALRRAKRAVEIELATNLAGDNNNALRSKLTDWWNGIQKPEGKAFKAFNDAINFAYIGGNARVAVADMLGKVQMQYPKLSDYVGGFGAERIFAKTIGNEIDWWRSKTKEDFSRRAGKGGAELWDGITEAQRKNLISTGVEKRLSRIARGRNNSFVDYALDMHFALKDISERSSDVSGFINGWNAFPEWARSQPKGTELPTRQQFAEKFLVETRAVPTQTELPATFRSPVVRTATKFKMYQAKIGKTMLEAGWPARVRYLVLAGLSTGFMGLPGSKDASNVGRSFGVDTEEELRKKGARSGTLYGPLSQLAGIDFSGSAGFGEAIPNINNADWWKKAAIGIAGAPFDQATRAKQYFDRDQTLKGIASLPFMPQEASNLLKAYEASTRGLSTLGGQTLIAPEDVTSADAIKKAFGFQPLAWKEAQALEAMRQGAAATGKDNSYLPQRMGAALAEGDNEAYRALQEEARQSGVKVNWKNVMKYKRAAEGKLNLGIERAAKDDKQRLRDMSRLFE